jgi:hypothetical protein
MLARACPVLRIAHQTSARCSADQLAGQNCQGVCLFVVDGVVLLAGTVGGAHSGSRHSRRPVGFPCYRGAHPTPVGCHALDGLAWGVHQVFRLRNGWGRPDGDAMLPRFMSLGDGCALSRNMYSQWCNTLAADTASGLQGLVGAVAAAYAIWRLSSAARFVQDRTVQWLHLRACAAILRFCLVCALGPSRSLGLWAVIRTHVRHSRHTF